MNGGARAPRVGATVLADFTTSEEPQERLMRHHVTPPRNFDFQENQVLFVSYQILGHLFNIRVKMTFQPVVSVILRRRQQAVERTGHENCSSYLVRVCDVALSRTENTTLLFDE